MNRLHRIALLVAAVAIAVAFFAIEAERSVEPVAASAEPADTPRAARSAVDDQGQGRATARPEEVVERRHTLRYDRTVILGAAEQAIGVEGRWTVLPLGADRVQVQLELEDYVADGPAPSGLELPFQLGLSADGALTGAGFNSDVPPATRNLLVEIAAALAYTPGEGEAWWTEETDLNGSYAARYHHQPDGGIERVRHEYLSVHTAQGLKATGEGLSVDGRTLFRVDEHGPVEVSVAENTTRVFGKVNITAIAAVQARLVRTHASVQPLPQVRHLPLRPIAPLIDSDGLRAADRNRIGDADLSTAMSWLDELERSALEGAELNRLEGGVHARLRAFTRLHPEVLPEYLELLRGADDERARSMVSALGAAGTAETTAALVDLLDDDLSAGVARSVHHALNMTQAPSGDSVRGLLAQVDDPENGDTAMLAAANQVRNLDGAEAEAAKDVVELLLERYEEAPDNSTRGLVIASMGNTGDARVLPALQHALQTGNVTLARYAAYAYRHIPGAEVELILEGLLTQHPFEAVRIQAMRSVEVRGPALWAEKVEAWMPQFGAMPHLQAAARTVLSRWAGPEAAMVASN